MKREFGRVKINGHTYKKIFMDKKVCYKIKINDVVYYEEHETPDEAIKTAEMYFSQDHSLKEADILKYTVDNVGITVRNRNYEKTIVGEEKAG